MKKRMFAVLAAGALLLSMAGSVFAAAPEGGWGGPIWAAHGVSSGQAWGAAVSSLAHSAPGAVGGHASGH